jgi:hypothetical protein
MTQDFEALTTFEQIESVRQEWEQFQRWPETDPDFVRLIVESRVEVQGPYVIVLRRDGKVTGFLIGRVETVRLNGAPGFGAAIQPKLKVLEVLHGGMLGNWSEEQMDGLLRQLKTSLSRGDWQAVRFRMLDVRLPLWLRSQLQFPWLCRGCVDAPNPHWSLRLPKSYEEFYQNLDSKTRKNLKRHTKLLESDFSDFSIKRLDQVADLDTILDTTDSIISKTYQKGFETAWTSDEMRKRVSLWLSKGLFKGFFLYANGKACAYQHVLKYRGRAFAVGTGYDPGFQRYGVGRYIQFEAVKDLCAAGGVTELDFGYGDAEYKREICQCRQEEADLVLFGFNCLGLCGNTLRTAEIKAVRLVKRALKSAGVFASLKKAWRDSRRKNP